MSEQTIADKPGRWWWQLYLFAAVAMAYGWGWRGVYGHEAGAMLPGAVMAMAVCLGSWRRDWYRRALVAGLCGAIGWSWGGQLTNMEHRLYIVSDSAVDAVYGFACIGLVGALWSGVGGATLAMAFTRSRSELNRFISPLIVQGTAFFACFLYFAWRPDVYEACARFTEAELHDNSWLSVTITLAVLLPWWLVRKQDRSATGLMLFCAAMWWIGYVLLTRLGGLLLAPPYRSESWGGVLGMLLALMIHHWRRRDRAALLITHYAMLAGCLGFILALQIHVPLLMAWGPFAELSPWKHAEESFGFFMGLGVAMGAGRLLQGRLAPAEEDADRRPLDLFSVLVLMIVMMWMNLWKNVRDWEHRYHVLPDEPFFWLQPPFPQFHATDWLLAVGLCWTGMVLYGLNQYRRGHMPLAPSSAFGKAGMVFVLVLITSLAGTVSLVVAAWTEISTIFSDISMMTLSGIAIWMLFSRGRESLNAPEPDSTGVAASDLSWRVGRRFWLLWAWVPIHVVLAGVIATAMVDAPWKADEGKERHRFGDRATWKLEQRKTDQQRSMESIDRRLRSLQQRQEELQQQQDELSDELQKQKELRESLEQPATGHWSPAAPMRERREYAGGVTLPDGRILVVSGHPLGGQSIASAEVYDPAAGRWSTVGSLSEARNSGNQATLLTDGRVLLAGGHSQHRIIPGAELFDGKTGSWAGAGFLQTPRDPVAIRLQDHRVLCAGGINWHVGGGQVYADCEMFDPRTSQWNPAAPMRVPRCNHRMVLLDDGRALAVGGYGPSQGLVSTVEVYDPEQDDWQAVCELPEPRAWFSMARLQDGRVLAAGGFTGTMADRRYLSSVVLYDPQADRWKPAAPMRMPRAGFSMTVLPNQRILVAGGVIDRSQETATAELYHVDSDKWHDVAPMLTERRNHRAALLSDGGVLVMGGSHVGGREYLNSCEVFHLDEPNGTPP